jgi:hypothetical protein
VWCSLSNLADKRISGHSQGAGGKERLSAPHLPGRWRVQVPVSTSLPSGSCRWARPPGLSSWKAGRGAAPSGSAYLRHGAKMANRGGRSEASMRADERETDGWTLAEKAYSAWIRAAREKDTAGAVALARRMAAHLDKAGMLEQVPPVCPRGCPHRKRTGGRGRPSPGGRRGMGRPDGRSIRRRSHCARPWPRRSAPSCHVRRGRWAGRPSQRSARCSMHCPDSYTSSTELAAALRSLSDAWPATNARRRQGSRSDRSPRTAALLSGVQTGRDP